MQTNTPFQYKLLSCLLLVAGLAACNKLLEVKPPPREIPVDNAFNDSGAAMAAISSIYHQMIIHGYFEWGGITYNTARSADEAMHHAFTDFFAGDSLLYTNADVRRMWQEAFSGMLMINTCISGLQASTKLSTNLHSQLLGEALFCRAFVYFYLVNIWGDAIPLITNPDVNASQRAPSVPRQKIYDQIITDLHQAQQLLSHTYPSAGRVRPNRMAANALLARVYLYQGSYSDAIAQATTVINSNLYTPLPSPSSVFLLSSKETIWQLNLPEYNGQQMPTGDAALFLGTATSLTPQLLTAFESGDQRRQLWVIDNNFADTVYTTAYKYKRLLLTATPTENYIVLRTAEQYLIRAEANTHLGQTTAAIADLNIIRVRAGLPTLPVTLTPQQCMTAVEQERRVELFCEWAHRWFDLKRWPGISNPNITRADEVLGAIKRDWQSTDQWYPVPRAELQLNPCLVQNPGYPAQ